MAKSPPPADPAAKRPRGRPSGYTPDMLPQIEKLCRLGATDLEIADFYDVDVRTIHRWKLEHEDFCHALKVGKETSDARVERSLYQRATGYSYDTVKIFNADGQPLIVPYREHVPPSDTAMIFWLKNRKPAEWRDRAPEQANSGVTVVIRKFEGEE